LLRGQSTAIHVIPSKVAILFSPNKQLTIWSVDVEAHIQTVKLGVTLKK
jgi:hypothetical protein